MIAIFSNSELEVQVGASTPVLSSQFTPTKRPPSSSESRLAPWTALCNVLICISLGFLASESDVDDEAFVSAVGCKKRYGIYYQY